MYIAGLDIHDILRRGPLSHEQGVECIMWLTTLGGVVRVARRVSKGRLSHHCHAGRHEKGLPDTAIDTGVKPPTQHNIGEKLTPPVLLKVLSALAHSAILVTPTVYLASVAYGRLEQPEWFRNWEFPHPGLTAGQFAAVKTAAAVLNYSLLYYLKRVSKAVDEAAKSGKHAIPTQYPYSLVRHPMSFALLMTQATYAVMWWNWIPVASFAATAAYLTVGLPYEEKLAEEDVLTGAEYIVYKRKVKYRLIPCIW